jgi:hypothetical protein
MGSDLLVGLYELRWIWNGRKIFKDGKIERAYVTTQADSLYERYLSGTRFFAQHSILWMAILATSGHNYLDILIWMGIVSMIAFYSRNRISYTTVIRGLSQGMHGGEILAQPCCFLGFYLSALQVSGRAKRARERSECLKLREQRDTRLLKAGTSEESAQKSLRGTRLLRLGGLC